MSFVTKSNLTIGPLLGSQMSQYAGLYALHRRLGMDIVFLSEYINLDRGVRLFDGFDLNPKIVSVKDISFSNYDLLETECDNEVFSIDAKMNWNIGGCFHLYHYWDRFRTDIKRVFSFRDHIVNSAKENIDKIRSDESDPIISIHFRRGDYLTVSSLNLSLDYYNAALNKISQLVPKFKLVVFSDDIPWCKDIISGDNVSFSENNSNYVDMCMMSMCDHNIIANSSFSWWGAYLNDRIDRIVICPENYVNSKVFNFINGNYYPKDWIALKEK